MAVSLLDSHETELMNQIHPRRYPRRHHWYSDLVLLARLPRDC